MHHVMCILHEAVLEVENLHTYSGHLHGIMVEIRNKFRTRVKDKFSGAETTKGLKHQSSTNKEIFMRDAPSVYQRSLSYLEKC